MDEKHLKGTMAEIAEIAEADALRERADEHEVDVLEFALDHQGIEELIAGLHELKETQEPITFAIDADNDLVIHFDGGEAVEDETADEPASHSLAGGTQ